MYKINQHHKFFLNLIYSNISSPLNWYIVKKSEDIKIIENSMDKNLILKKKKKKKVIIHWPVESETVA